MQGTATRSCVGERLAGCIGEQRSRAPPGEDPQPWLKNPRSRLPPHRTKPGGGCHACIKPQPLSRCAPYTTTLRRGAFSVSIVTFRNPQRSPAMRVLFSFTAARLRSLRPSNPSAANDLFDATLMPPTPRLSAVCAAAATPATPV